MNHRPRFWLNIMAMGLIGAGALLTTITQPGSTLNGLLWGALIAWFAAARVNGQSRQANGSGPP